MFRAANGKVPLHPDDPHVVAIATDVRIDSPLPQFALDDVAQIADFVCVHNGLA